MEQKMTFEQKLIFWIRETMRLFDWHVFTVIVFAYIVAYYQSIEDCEELENENSFYFPNVILEEFANLNAYTQNKALKELELKGILKVNRKGLRNRRYIELSLFVIQDILSNIDAKYDEFYYELRPND
jgi:hypothetical protein